MKFAFMGRILDYEGYGMKTLLAGLLKNILSINRIHEIFIFIDPEQLVPSDIIDGPVNIVNLPPRTNLSKGRFIWDHFSVGHMCKKLKIDALYAPAHVRPLYAPCPVVVSVLDMMYHKFPSYWSFSERLYFNLAVSYLTPKATIISALSNNTKQDILYFLNVTEEKVEVVYPGVPYGFRKYTVDETRHIREKYSLSKPYIFFAGANHPRKNVLGLVEAFENVAGDIPHELVLVGSNEWTTLKLVDRLSNSPFATRIRSLGLIPLTDLVMLYNEADVFVYPSLYEGFGFPVLEALACGCPVISTNISSIPEVAGDSAILVKPGNVNELSLAIKRVVIDRTLREELAQASLLQSKNFNWETTARKTIGLLEEAVIRTR